MYDNVASRRIEGMRETLQTTAHGWQQTNAYDDTALSCWAIFRKLHSNRSRKKSPLSRCKANGYSVHKPTLHCTRHAMSSSPASDQQSHTNPTEARIKGQSNTHVHRRSESIQLS